jgi:MarR family transcriptional regulator, transcriptional regulator for hemolysin
MPRSESILSLLSQACRLLWREAAREVAERLEVEPIPVARILDRLAACNLLECRPDPRDRRCWRVHLTPLAARMRSLAAERRVALGREIANTLPDPVAAALECGLAHAVAALGTEIAPAGKREFIDA